MPWLADKGVVVEVEERVSTTSVFIKTVAGSIPVPKSSCLTYFSSISFNASVIEWSATKPVVASSCTISVMSVCPIWFSAKLPEY